MTTKKFIFQEISNLKTDTKYFHTKFYGHSMTTWILPGTVIFAIYKLYDWLKFSFKFAELHCYIFVNLWYSILEITYFVSIFITVFNCQMILVSLHNICQPRPGLSFCFNKKAKRLSTLMFLPERNKKNPGKASVF